MTRTDNPTPAGRRAHLRQPTFNPRARVVSAAELVAEMEAEDPATVAAGGLSSAAMRAGDLVRLMRREAGLAQALLAERIGVSQSRIAELEAGRGQQGPTWDVMDRLARACGRELGVLPRPPADTNVEPPETMVERTARVVEAVVLRADVHVGVAGRSERTPA